MCSYLEIKTYFLVGKKCFRGNTKVKIIKIFRSAGWFVFAYFYGQNLIWQCYKSTLIYLLYINIAQINITLFTFPNFLCFF